MKRILLLAGTVMLGTISYLALGIALASAG
jgi:hypothetical protein